MRVFALASVLAVASATYAQLPAAPKAEFKLDAKTAVAGGLIKGKVTVTFADGLHSYQNPPTDESQIPLKLSITDKTFKLVSVTYPKGTDATLAGDTKPSKVYAGKIVIPVTIRVPKKTGKQTVSVVVAYQQCNDTSCFPPDNLVVKAQLAVTAAKKGK